MPKALPCASKSPWPWGESSEPEPDVAIVCGRPRDYLASHPTVAVLVVEISDSSLKYDREYKQGLYAASGTPEYWILNLIDYRLEVYRDPDQERETYRSCTVLTRNGHGLSTRSSRRLHLRRRPAALARFRGPISRLEKHLVEPRFLRSFLRLPIVRPTHQGRQRDQNRLNAPLGLQTKERPSVANQVKLHIAAPAVELELPLPLAVLPIPFAAAKSADTQLDNRRRRCGQRQSNAQIPPR